MKLLKALGLTLIYAVGVALLSMYIFPDSEINSTPEKNMIMTLFCLPGVFFFMDYLSNQDNNSPE